MAGSLQIGRYGGWRLPYAFEYDQLYSRLDADWSPRTAAQRSGLTKTLLLKDLGFQLYQLSSSHQFWWVDFNGFYQPFGSFTYDLDGGGASIFPASGQHDAPFVRSYVESTDSSFSDDAEPNAALRVDSSSSPGGVTQLKATMNFQCPIGPNSPLTAQPSNPSMGATLLKISGSGAFPSWASPKAPSVPTRTSPALNGNQTCTFTGSFQGTIGSITLTRPSDLQWQVDSILLTPNQSSVSFAQNSTQEVLFVATGSLKTRPRATGPPSVAPQWEGSRPPLP